MAFVRECLMSEDKKKNHETFASHFINICSCAARVIEKLTAAGFMNTTEQAEAAGRKKANTEGTSLKAKRQLLTRSEDGGLPVEVIDVTPSLMFHFFRPLLTYAAWVVRIVSVSGL